MIRKTNPLKEKLRRREPVITAMLRFPNPTFAVIMAKAGVEAITIDDEHYPFTETDIVDIARAVRGEGANCFIRLGNKRPDAIYRAMDMGVDGVLLPNVETKEEALELIDAVKYPPRGKRGCCPITRGANYGLGATPTEYYGFIDDTTIVGVMIESKKGYENLDEIMSVPGIDYFAVGPSDFSGSYGKPGKAGTDLEIKAAIEDCVKRILGHGYAMSCQAYTKESCAEGLKKGRTVLNIGSDCQMMTAEFKKHVEEANSVIREEGYTVSKRPVWEKMRSKEPFAMPYMRIADPAVMEIAALAGVELMILDDEHFPFTERDLADCIRAIHARGAKALVRVHDKSKAMIGKILDIGADGIVAPQVQSYEEAREIVLATKYGPAGDRGLCPITAGANYGYGHSMVDYAKEANEKIICGIMVETKGAVEDIDKILSIPELDYISVGPSDVSASFGFPGQYDHPVVKNAMKSVWNKCRESHVAMAGQCYTKEKVAPVLSDGKSLLNIGSDLQYMIWGFDKHVAEIKKAIEENK